MRFQRPLQSKDYYIIVTKTTYDQFLNLQMRNSSRANKCFAY